MKNDLPCAIVQDLLPNYLEKLTSEESNEKIAEHLAHCAVCQSVYEEMKKKADLVCANAAQQNTEDKELFKKVNRKLKRQTKKAIVTTAAIAAVIFGGSLALFNLPLKSVDWHDVQIEAEVYPLADLVVSSEDEKSTDNTAVLIYDGDDKEQPLTIRIPNSALTFSLTADTMKNNEYLTKISVCSQYFLRAISQDEFQNDGILRIKAFKTTLLNNKSDNFMPQNMTLEFRKIEKIVYVNADNSEILLWENPAK